MEKHDASDSRHATRLGRKHVSVTMMSRAAEHQSFVPLYNTTGLSLHTTLTAHKLARAC
jgi:hypothetical protein